MRVLDLFSGIGGFSLGLERAGMETVAFCEKDKFCRQLLKKHWPSVPIHEDVFSLDGKEYAGSIDLICGGFPCQPFSVAGKQKGKDDNRYLWPEMFRIIQEAKPTWFIGENVSGIINLALEQVCADLESEGYEVQTLIIPACAVNAPHKRSRVWILGHAKHNGFLTPPQNRVTNKTNDHFPERENKNSESKGSVGIWEGLATNAENERCQGSAEKEIQGVEFRALESLRTFTNFGERWNLPTSRVCRGDDGIPDRSHRIKALGNAVVPQIPEILGKYIMEIHNEFN